MKIPLRIIQIKELSRKDRFSLLGGIKTLGFNLKTVCTRRLLANCNGWYVQEVEREVIGDVSLVWKGGDTTFIKTPKGEHDVALELTQNID